MPPTGTTDNSSSQSGANEPAVSSGLVPPELMAAVEAASSADSAPAATPAGDTTQQAGEGTPASGAGTTVQPAEATKPAVSQPATGDAPQSRIEAAVRNARERAIAETEARFASFQGLNPQDVQMALSVLNELRSDPAGFWKELGSRVNAQAEPEEVDEAYPEADLRSKDGTLRTYSESTFQKALEVHGRKVTRQIMADLKPVVDWSHRTQTEAQQREDQAQREQVIRGALEEARSLPHFTKENEQAILESLQAIPAQKRTSLGPVAALHRAYTDFLRDRVFPGIDAAAEARVRKTLTAKANTSAGQVHPVDQGTSQRPVIKGESDLAAHMERLAAG